MELETTRAIQEIRPISRDTDASQVALAVYGRLFDLLDRLEPDAWEAPTECTGWDVAAMVGHLIGAGRACASMRESARQQWWGRRHADEFGGNTLDAANELQVREHAGLSPTERIRELREVAPAAVRGRMRLPRPLRRIAVSLDQGGSTAPGMPDRVVFGHLMDTIYTRDVWLHTVDIARATSTPFEPEPGVDGRIIEDVVAEWARRHGQPFELTLTGPAGGRFRGMEEGGHLDLDAIEYCRILSGRADPAGADAGPIDANPPRMTELLATKVVF